MDTNEELSFEKFVDDVIDIFSYIAIGGGFLLILGSILRILL